MIKTVAAIVAIACGGIAHAADFDLQLRTATYDASNGSYTPKVVEAHWPAAQTAVIVCDTWDMHHSINAVKRLEEFAPRMDAFIREARSRGAIIIHAPSDCMPAYEGHPARKRAIAAPKAGSMPPNMPYWNPRMKNERGELYPLDQSEDVEDDDPAEHAAWVEKLKAMGRNPLAPWKTQSPLISIDEDGDYITDKGDEVWNILQARGIRNVMLMGVHANMCVLGRPFGLRNLVEAGKQAVLIRDLTDCMYNPARWPYVDHFTGNDLLVRYIETTVCSTITSDQILGGEPFHFSGDTREGFASVSPRREEGDWWRIQFGPGYANHHDGFVGPIWLRCVLWKKSNRVYDKLDIGESFGKQARLRAWLNGVELAPASSDGSKSTLFTISPDQLRDRGTWWLTVKAETHDCNLLLNAPSLLQGSTVTPLEGGWQFLPQFAGGEKDVSSPAMPAQFGGSPNITIEIP